ncbi:MAG: class I SAM-dependent methyltransferase [Anaerolineales bacterium]|nr:class I SAM-dependent methyltransferase [Anaerolineales bacterium]
MNSRDMNKAALRGEPSYVWRAGQERRLAMVLAAAGELLHGRVIDNGCGVGMYVRHLLPLAGSVFGMEYDLERAQEARQFSPNILCGAGENIPLPDKTFDVILSHEVLEHVQDDRQAVEEMSRLLRPGGRMVIFVPNRGYPFETHGIYWHGKYHFGNIPMINYLPDTWRNRLAPHVRVYSTHTLEQLFTGLPLRLVKRQIIFGAYDNVIARWKVLGKLLRTVLQALEKTPFQILGLSHFWVLEKIE